MAKTAVPAIGELSPMLLSERTCPPADEDHYLASIKYDGYRVLGQFGDDECVLKSRQGADCSAWFPEVRQALAPLTVGRSIVDGEMCVLDTLGRSDFDALHQRAQRRRWKPGDPVVTYCVFDLLVVDGRNIMQLPLVQRLALLAQLLDPVPPHILVVGYVDAAMVARPVSWLYAQVLELQLEGVVGKRAASPYIPGDRNADWFKLKRPGATPPGRFRRGQ